MTQTVEVAPDEYRFESIAAVQSQRTRAALHRRPSRFGQSKVLAVLFAAVVAVPAWLAFAPRQLAGFDSYAIVNGISMLPHFHTGDLVVLRAERTYRVGEVAAYHNAQLGVVVMHRIVAIHGDRYVFKGDNNDFADNYEPTRSQIIGAEWIHIPAVGRLFNGLRVPIVAAIALALLWLLSFKPSPVSRRRQRSRHHVR